MITKDVITPVIQAVKNQRNMLDEVERFLADSSSLIDGLCDEHELIDKMELTQDHLIIHPLGERQALVEVLEDNFDCIFTRSAVDSGVYQWDCTPTNYNFTLRIQANEVIDLSGTLLK